jgi:hypothetical protein
VLLAPGVEAAIRVAQEALANPQADHRMQPLRTLLISRFDLAS